MDPTSFNPMQRIYLEQLHELEQHIGMLGDAPKKAEIEALYDQFLRLGDDISCLKQVEGDGEIKRNYERLNEETQKSAEKIKEIAANQGITLRQTEGCRSLTTPPDEAAFAEDLDAAVDPRVMAEDREFSSIMSVLEGVVDRGGEFEEIFYKAIANSDFTKVLAHIETILQAPEVDDLTRDKFLMVQMSILNSLVIENKKENLDVNCFLLCKPAIKSVVDNMNKSFQEFRRKMCLQAIGESNHNRMDSNVALLKSDVKREFLEIFSSEKKELYEQIITNLAPSEVNFFLENCLDIEAIATLNIPVDQYEEALREIYGQVQEMGGMRTRIQEAASFIESMQSFSTPGIYREIDAQSLGENLHITLDNLQNFTIHLVTSDKVAIYNCVDGMVLGKDIPQAVKYGSMQAILHLMNLNKGRYVSHLRTLAAGVFAARGERFSSTIEVNDNKYTVHHERKSGGFEGFNIHDESGAKVGCIGINQTGIDIISLSDELSKENITMILMYSLQKEKAKQMLATICSKAHLSEKFAIQAPGMTFTFTDENTLVIKQNHSSLSLTLKKEGGIYRCVENLSGREINFLQEIQKSFFKIDQADFEIKKFFSHLESLPAPAVFGSAENKKQHVYVPDYAFIKQPNGSILFSVEFKAAMVPKRDVYIKVVDGELIFYQDADLAARIDDPSKIRELHKLLLFTKPVMKKSQSGMLPYSKSAVIFNQKDLYLELFPEELLRFYVQGVRENRASGHATLFPEIVDLQSEAIDAGGPTKSFLREAFPRWIELGQSQTSPRKRMKIFMYIGELLIHTYGKIPAGQTPPLHLMTSLPTEIVQADIESGFVLERNAIDFALSKAIEGTKLYNDLQRLKLHLAMIEDMDGILYVTKEEEEEESKVEAAEKESKVEQPIQSRITKEDIEFIAEIMDDTLEKGDAFEIGQESTVDLVTIEDLRQYVQNPANREALEEYCKRFVAYEMDHLEVNPIMDANCMAASMVRIKPGFLAELKAEDFNDKLMGRLDISEVVSIFTQLSENDAFPVAVKQKLLWITKWIGIGGEQIDTFKIEKVDGVMKLVSDGQIRGLSSNDVAKLLEFITGAPFIPAKGDRKIEIQTNGGDLPPLSHTCFNRMDISTKIESEKEFREKIEICLALSKNFTAQ